MMYFHKCRSRHLIDSKWKMTLHYICFSSAINETSLCTNSEHNVENFALYHIAIKGTCIDSIESYILLRINLYKVGIATMTT